jgi:hypothetical protein
VAPETSFVVIVESPYPALDVTGVKPGVPTLFWVHHGEHHLPANLRLTTRYQADAVLMAHSWHLAHRFPVPIHRFPFAVAPELDPGAHVWRDRRSDVAMVGSGIGGTGTRYARRREIADALDSDQGIDVELAYGLSPDEMIALYGNSRIVVNDGGPRHFPITMRVFEALGAGSLLVTEDIPGTDAVLRRGEHYVVMEEDVAAQVHRLLQHERSSSIAASGRRWVNERHTYDHRIDQLVDLAGVTEGRPGGRKSSTAKSPLATLIDQDVEVQHLAVFGDPGHLGLDDRAVRRGDATKLSERSIDAVVIGDGEVPDLRRAVLAARGYVYADASHREDVARILERDRPEAAMAELEGLLRADIGGAPYRMRPADHPLST